MFFITFIADRIGRKRPLIYGILAITAALICESAINSQNVDGEKTGLSIAGVAFLFCVTIIFSLSFGPVSWTYMAEIMPYQIRGKGCAFATGIGNWLVATFWAQVSPYGLKELGWKFYFLFVGMLQIQLYHMRPPTNVKQPGTLSSPSPFSSSSSAKPRGFLSRRSISCLATVPWVTSPTISRRAL